MANQPLPFLKNIDENHPEVFFVEGDTDGKYPHSHSALFGDILIDTGISRKRMKRFLKDGPKINRVLLSHWHEDHTGGNRFLFDSPHIQFYCHPLDRPPIENVPLMVELYGVKKTPIEEPFIAFFETFRLKNTPIHHEINDGDLINVGEDLKLQVFHMPGHSRGHLCFYEPSSKIAFLSDIDLTGIGPWYGCYDSNVEDFEKSIKRLQQLQIKFAVTSHKGIVIGESEIQNQLSLYLAVIDQRDQKILGLMKETRSIKLEDLLRKNIVYKSYNQFGEYLVLAEKIMIEQHLRKLQKEGKIQHTAAGYLCC